MKITYLFLLFMFSPPGKGRLRKWRAFRSLCLKRAQVSELLSETETA